MSNESISYSFTSDGVTFNITITDLGDGNFKFDVAIDENSAIIGDIRAFYFDVDGDVDSAGLEVVGSEGTSFVTGETSSLDEVSVIDEGDVKVVESKDTNLNGEVKGSDLFDAGVEFGDQGMAHGDDYQVVSFTLSGAEEFSLSDFDMQDIGIRLTSVGTIDGSRDGSLKISDTFDADPLPPAAADDVINTDEDTAVTGINIVAATDANDPDTSVLGADTDPDGDDAGLVVTKVIVGTTETVVSSTGTTAFTVTDAAGRSVDVTIDAAGNVSVATPEGFDTSDEADGRFLFSYEITDADGLTDTATVTINVDDLIEPLAPEAVSDQIFTDDATTVTGLNIVTGLDNGQESSSLNADNDPDGDNAALTVSSATVDGVSYAVSEASPAVFELTEGGNTVRVEVDHEGNTSVEPIGGFEANDGSITQFTFMYQVTDEQGEVSNQAEVTINVTDPDVEPPLNEGPEINIVFLVDAGVEATAGYAAGTSMFSASLDALEQVVGGIQNTLAQYSTTFDVDVGVYSFESQDVGDVPELEAAKVLTDGTNTTFDLSTDFGSVIAAHETAVGTKFGDNGSDFYDQGRTYYEKAFEAANGFFVTNDDMAIDDTINLVYVLSTGSGADIGNGLPLVPFAPIQYFDEEFLTSIGVPDVTGNAALTDELIKTNFIHEALVDTLFFGTNSTQGTAVHALEAAVLGLNPAEDLLGDGFIKTNASDFVTSVENGLTDELAEFGVNLIS